MDYIPLIKDRIKISSLVGESVVLKNSGSNMKGLCPFHSEKTPSFTVNDTRGTYHCFGCAAHGDIFSFMENKYGLSFKEALEQLAGRAGVTLPKPERKKDTKELEILRHATDWFVKQLNHDVKQYLLSRGVNEALQTKFSIGYAPKNGLFNHLLSLGFEKDLIFDLGLCRRNDYKGVVDFFWDRIMFPIRDISRNVIGFGGRATGDVNPKYVNSSDSSVFKKGLNLYNQENATDGTPVFVVEGYMDVIAMSKSGHDAVAPLGTALTKSQLESLWGRGCKPILCFDGDDAGIRATKRAVEMASSEKNLRVVLLPIGEDPASLMLNGTLDQELKRSIPWQEFLRNPVEREKVLFSMLLHAPDFLEERGEEIANLPLSGEFGVKVLGIFMDQIVKKPNPDQFRKNCIQGLKDAGFSDFVDSIGNLVLPKNQDMERELKRLIQCFKSPKKEIVKIN